MTETPVNLTPLLLKSNYGDKSAVDEILPLVYNELRHIVSNLWATRPLIGQFSQSNQFGGVY